MYNTKTGKYYYYTVWNGKTEKKECKTHEYAYTGIIPCTGEKRCVRCGKYQRNNES